MVTTSSKKYYDVVMIVKRLGVDVSQALPWFHAFTGCDTVSSFNGKGKLTMWDSWMASSYKNYLTALFGKLSEAPPEITDIDFQLIKRFVLGLYKTKSASETLGSLRMKMFITSAVDDLKMLPPSEGALLMHTKRATLQAGYFWKESDSNIIVITNPELWGWSLRSTANTVLLPQWEAMASGITISNFILTCSCRTKSCKSCKCAKAKLACIIFCNCMRECTNIK